MNTRRIFCCLLISLLCNGLVAQTFHYIGFFDTKDQRIGVSVTSDMEAFQGQLDELEPIFQQLGFNTDIQFFSGNECGKDQLVNALNAMSIRPDDVVLFAYGGHGAHSNNPADTDRFPQMCLGSSDQSRFVPAQWVKNVIESKGPRLTIVITDCCNKESDWVSTKPIDVQRSTRNYQNEVVEMCRRLFVEPRGSVIITAAQKGEYAWGNDSGSTFLSFFWPRWEAMKTGALSANWSTFFAAVKADCSQKPIRCRDEVFWQHPYYEVALKEENPEGIVPQDRKASEQQRMAARTSARDLDRAVNQLLDKSLSHSIKTKKIQEIRSDFFPEGSVIVTYLEDRNTIIRYERAEDFLNRIAKSNDISRVSFFRAENNKYSAYEYYR